MILKKLSKALSEIFILQDSLKTKNRREILDQLKKKFNLENPELEIIQETMKLINGRDSNNYIEVGNSSLYSDKKQF